VDRADRLAGARGVEPEGVVRRARLDDDDAERVGNDVMELTGDARLLLRHCAPRLALSLALEPLCLLLDLTHVGAPRADAVAEPRVTVEPAPDHRRGSTVTRLGVMCGAALGVAPYEQRCGRRNRDGAVAEQQQPAPER